MNGIASSRLTPNVDSVGRRAQRQREGPPERVQYGARRIEFGRANGNVVSSPHKGAREDLC